METEQKLFVCIHEKESSLQEKLLCKGVKAELFREEGALWNCHVAKRGEKVCLAFEEGATLFFAEEQAAAEFLYMVICHCLYLQMMTVDFGNMMGILGHSDWENPIQCKDWERREELPFWSSVLSTHVLPDEEDPELCFQYMNEADDALMEHFAEDSQIIMIFGEVDQEQRKLFWVES